MNLLAVDIGNSDTVFGVWTLNATLPIVFRIETASILQNPLLIRQALDLKLSHFPSPTIEKVILSSVVPQATDLVRSQIVDYTRLPIQLLDHSQFHKLPIQVLKPDEIGTDLVANALAAYSSVQQNCIIVDFGTALSFTTIDQGGKIIGVSIAPGLLTALKALTAHTAQLQTVPLTMPPSSLGKNTEEAIQTGILYGYDGLVRGIINAQEKELGLDLYVIVTGGLSHSIPTLNNRVNLYSPYLTLEGLKIAAHYL
ncbi:MAG: type III pantothenate kinase [Saprospiraceae bacterium]|nr:type III pantothenate kinase [Saprospiraceae bacterium]